MKKILILGCPGAGKSTFAKRLRAALSIPVYHLDMIWHKPDKTNITREEFDLRICSILPQEKWIIDGNYLWNISSRIEACDTIFFLDYPVQTCLEGARSRIGKERDDLPWLEEELDDEFREYIEAFPENQLQKLYLLLKQYEREKMIYTFRNREEAEKFLLNI